MAKAVRSGVAEENVVIRAGGCSLTILPRLGGKIASIKVGDLELLQPPLAAYVPRTQNMAFDQSDASGWDECLPSVAACAVETESGVASIPDHGDLWRLEWEAKESESGASSVTLCGRCFSLPLVLERTLELFERPGGWSLELNYTVKNTGAEKAPWSWAAHPLFTVQAGDRIVLPDSVNELRLEGSGGGRLGSGGDEVEWPIAMLANGSRTDLSVVQPASSAIGDKLFAGPLSAAGNWCALERPKAGVRIKLSFEPTLTPFLGLWICYGGWPEGPGAKQMCVALEPATAPVDSLAETGPWSRILDAGESYSWPMTVEIESITSVN
jgi:galactose mutarotase-like enzyme